MIYNLALVPPEQYWEEFRNKVPQSKLLPENIPHVTVLQVEHDEPDVLWKSLDGLRSLEETLHVSGFGLVPQGNLIWVELSIYKTAYLDELQNDLVGRGISYKRIKNTIFDFYRPHITLGLVDRDHISLFSPFDLNQICIGNSCKFANTFRLCLGRSGPNFEFMEILYGE